MESRLLWTLLLPHNILSAHSRAGYETVADIQSATATPQALADGLFDQPNLHVVLASTLHFRNIHAFILCRIYALYPRHIRT